MTRKFILKYVVLAGLTLNFMPVAFAQAGGKSNNANALNSVVKVEATFKNGRTAVASGWIIEPRSDKRAGAGMIVTRLTSVTGAKKLQVVENGSVQTRDASVFRLSRESGLAFVEVRGLNGAALSINSQNAIGMGDNVEVLGFERNNDRFTRVRWSIDSTSDGERVGDSTQLPVAVLRYAAQPVPGLIGGPVVNKCDQVVGALVGEGGKTNTVVAPSAILKAANIAQIIVKTSPECPLESVDEGAVPAKPILQSTADSSINDDKVNSPDKRRNWFMELLDKLFGLSDAAQIILLTIAIISLIAIVGILVNHFIKNGWGKNKDNTDTIGNGNTIVSQDITYNIGKTGLHLTGRTKDGRVEAELSFTKSQLSKSKVMLGTEGDSFDDVTGVIADNRERPYVSRKHAVLYYEGDNYMIMDNKSTNHSRINGSIISPFSTHKLSDGDKLTLGDLDLNVRID